MRRPIDSATAPEPRTTEPAAPLHPGPGPSSTWTSTCPHAPPAGHRGHPGRNRCWPWTGAGWPPRARPAPPPPEQEPGSRARLGSERCSGCSSACLVKAESSGCSSPRSRALPTAGLKGFRESAAHDVESAGAHLWEASDGVNVNPVSLLCRQVLVALRVVTWVRTQQQRP